MSGGELFIVLIAMLGGAIRVSTPFMFVALGECLTEKSGRINLGLEGNLVLGAMVVIGLIQGDDVDREENPVIGLGAVALTR